jgi:branched-chain amino acid transport system permease protein
VTDRWSLGSLRNGVVRVGALGAVFLVCGVIMSHKGVMRNLPVRESVLPVLGQSVFFGILFALYAVALVLVYRATRVINFAQGGFFVVAYSLFYALTVSLSLSYWLALPAAVLAGGAVAALSEILFIRRFFGSARLIVAVVTIGIAQLLGGVAGAIPGWIGHGTDPLVRFQSPLGGISRHWGPIVFTGDYLVVAVLGLGSLIGIGAFLRFTSMGTAIRGAAENGDRASELGVNIRSLSTIVWAIAGVLAAVGAALEIPILGYNSALASSPIAGGGVLVALAAAVIAGMDDVLLAVFAAIGISAIQQTSFFAFSDTAYVDGVLLVVIVVAFLAQRRRLGRTDEASSSTWAATEEMRPIPAELARLPVVRNAIRRLQVVGAIALLGFPFVMSPSQTNLGSLVFIDGIVVISLVILTGWGGQVSLGQYAFVGVGALVGAIVIGTWHLPFLVALFAGAAAGGAVALVLGLTALRVRGLYLAVTTLAFAIVMTTLVLDRSHLGRYAPTTVSRPAILFLKTQDNRVFYYVALLALGLTWFAALGLRRSRTGRVLIAMRDNERAAQAFGVNLVRTRLITFAISGFMAAAAGVLFVVHEHAVDARSFGADASVQIFLTAVIGGLGSIQGALFGAGYFALVNLTVHGGVGRLFASSIGVLLVLYAFPGGLGSIAYSARDAILRRIAIRRRIWVPSLLADSAVAAGRADRAPLAPKPENRDAAEQTPAVYRQESRVRLAGASQTGPRWRF